MSEEATKTRPEDLKLIDRAEVTKTLAPTENLDFTDLKPGDDIDVHFFGTKDEPRVDLGGTEFRILPKALEATARCIGMPAKYVSRCPADLLFPHLNYWFGEGMSNPIRAISSEDTLLGMTADRVKTQVVSNERLLRLAEEKIGTDHIVGYHQVYSDLKYSSMALVTDKSFEPVNQDTLFGGIKISNSILGKDTIEVSPYIFRQWCSNGAITEQALGKYTRKKHDNLDGWLQEIIEGADSQLDQEFDRIRHLTTVSVKGHVAETVNGVGDDRNLPGKVVEEVLNEAIASKAETMYDIYNAFTKIASHSTELTPMSANRLQHAAGVITKNHEICSQCHRVLN